MKSSFKGHKRLVLIKKVSPVIIVIMCIMVAQSQKEFTTVYCMRGYLFEINTFKKNILEIIGISVN